MSSRNVALRKDVYDAVAREKRGDESFTHVLLRLLGQKAAVDELYGSWGGHPAKRDAAAIRSLRGSEGRGSRR